MIIAADERQRLALRKAFGPDAQIICQNWSIMGLRVSCYLITPEVSRNTDWFRSLITRAAGPHTPVFRLDPVIDPFRHARA